MQIVGTVDPDSTSDDAGVVAARAAELVDEGADLVDVDTLAAGPRPLDVRRLSSLVRRLTAEHVPVGVTTTSADVVVGAVDAGACLVLDPSGGGMDRFMPQVVAAAGVPYVLGQSLVGARTWRPASPEEFRQRVATRARAFLEAGVAASRLVLDAGVGQLSHGDTEWGILEHLVALGGRGRPVFVDASWSALYATAPSPLDTEDDDMTAIGVCVLAAGANAWGVRVSNVLRAAAVLGGSPARSRHSLRTQSR